MIQEIWEKLNTFSDEAQRAAVDKARELSFDLNRGGIPLEESLINLSNARDLLKDAVEKKKLVQLPITIQRRVNELLAAISRGLTNLTTGTDEIPNLTAAIEELHVALWQYGLHNLSEEVLGYQTKLNQLKKLEVQISQLKKQLDEGIDAKAKLDHVLQNAETGMQTIQAKSTDSEAASEKIATILANVLDAQQEVNAALAAAKAHQETASQQAGTATTEASTAKAVAEKIQEFFGEIDQHRTKMEGAQKLANDTVKNNNDATAKLTTELGALEDQIREQIRRATGHSLFHSFQTRRDDVSKGKKYWIGGLGLLLTLSIGLTVWIASTYESLDTAFYLKLSASVPLIFAIVFCTVQYSRERRLEEEYAFKSNISISLLPYQELVEKLIDKTTPAEREKYSAFIIESVSKVFASPTDKIFETPEQGRQTPEKAIRQVHALIKTVVKGLKH